MITDLVRWMPLFLALLLSACGDSVSPPSKTDPESAAPIDAGPVETEVALSEARVPEQAEVSSASVKEIDWDSLIPEDFRPDKLMEEYQVEDLADDDPRAAELMDRLKELWDQAPVRNDLDGEQVSLPGFVVPVESDAEETTGFLLVPYYGACIHVPPPPANQTVYVNAEPGQGTRPKLFDVVTVTGTMRVERVESELAAAGYTLEATKVEPYEEEGYEEEPYEEAL